MPVDASDTKEYNASVYYRIKHETIKTYADLRNHLHDLFTDDIVKQLLSQADVIMHYADIHGALYAMMAD